MKPTLCLVVSSPMTVNAFLQEPIKQLANDYRIFLVCNGAAQDIALQIQPYLTVLPVAIERKISLLADLAALWHLFGLLRRYKFDVVHSVTPKAGMLAMLAGHMAGINVRIHTFTGQVWVNRRGLGRALLKTGDKMTASLASHILVDSLSQLRFLLSEKVLAKGKAEVLAKGSISGVDVDRFCPNENARKIIRHGMAIPDEARLFLFLGRLNLDKGVLDLAAAFNRVAQKYPNAHLLVVGPDEESLTLTMLEIIGEYSNRTHFVGHTDKPEDYMASSDVFCLPSHREGFGNVIIEAAAAGLPAIGSRIYGIVDAIEEGRTGLLHKVGDIEDMQKCMSKLASSNELFEMLGRQARERTIIDFSSKRLATAWLNYYRGLK